MDKEKKIFLIKAIAVGVAALVLIGIVLAFVRGLQPGGEPSEPDVIQGDISRPTEETLPPPPANPYFATDFSYGVDGYLHLTAGKSVVGVDVSEHQVNVDWQAVKDSGVEFVIIRVGYRGYESGELYADTEAQLRRGQGRRAEDRRLLLLSGPERRGSCRRSGLYVGADQGLADRYAGGL